MEIDNKLKEYKDWERWIPDIKRYSKNFIEVKIRLKCNDVVININHNTSSDIQRVEIPIEDMRDIYKYLSLYFGDSSNDKVNFKGRDEDLYIHAERGNEYYYLDTVIDCSDVAKNPYIMVLYTDGKKLFVRNKVEFYNKCIKKTEQNVIEVGGE